MDMPLDEPSFPVIRSTPLKEGSSLRRSQWANRLKQSMTPKKSKPKVIGDDESFMNLGKGSWGKSTIPAQGTPTSTPHEIATNKLTPGSSTRLRSQASKSLDQSPQPKCITAETYGRHSESRTSSRPMLAQSYSDPRADDRQTGSYNEYKSSLQSLIYLAENNPRHLVQLVDSLDENRHHSHTPAKQTGDKARPTRNSPSPPSPILKSPTFPPQTEYEYGHLVDPNSEEARRKRSSKLSSFFGEDGVDFTDPNVPPPRRRAARYD